MPEEFQLRLEVLVRAMQTVGQTQDADQVLRVAGKYLDFLKGTSNEGNAGIQNPG